MNRSLAFFLKKLGQSVLFWSLAMCCFAIFRFYGIKQEIGVAIEDGFEEGIFIQPLLFMTLLGVGLGILYSIIDFIIGRYVSKRVSLGLSLLFKTALYFIITVIMASLILSMAYDILDFDRSVEPGWWHQDQRFWTMIFYIVLASLVYSFLTIASERFGRGIFLKMLLGTYKRPKEEERIFMFIDLKNSTSIAERLGHFSYSSFIQDCFYDLNDLVLNYEAEIYQYVGDEVVLSWPYAVGIKNNNCVRLFYAFKKSLELRKEFYFNKYEVVPEFKAGVHGGALMVTEVGSVKKELAYHGDVINTSSRIQNECNKYDVALLLSEKILYDLKIDRQRYSESLGSVHLKGKNEQVNIHTLIHYA